MLNKKKKKKGKGKYYVAAGCCVAAAIFVMGLGLDIGGLGSGMGFPQFNIGQSDSNSNDDTTNNNNVTPDAPIATPPTETPPPASPPPVIEPVTLITVRGSEIVYDGSVVTLTQLRMAIEAIDEAQTLDWTLHHDNAILATMDEVQALLRELNISARETGA